MKLKYILTVIGAPYIDGQFVMRNQIKYDTSQTTFLN
jgi:hypothetical protein